MSKIVGYKTVDKDLRSWYDSEYKFEIGKSFTIKDPNPSNAPCGRGLHFAPTREHAEQFAEDVDFRLLVVESDTKFLLGKDDEKYRVSKLKIVKEIVLSKERAEKKKAFSRYEKAAKNWLSAKTPVTRQKINSVVKSWAKAEKIGNVKLHITDNIFEFAVLFSQFVESMPWRQSCYKSDDIENISPKDLPHWAGNIDFVDHYLFSDALHNVFSFFEADPVKGKGLMELVELGSLPVRLSNNKVLVFAPSKSIFSKDYFQF